MKQAARMPGSQHSSGRFRGYPPPYFVGLSLFYGGPLWSPLRIGWVSPEVRGAAASWRGRRQSRGQRPKQVLCQQAHDSHGFQRELNSSPEFMVSFAFTHFLFNHLFKENWGCWQWTRCTWAAFDLALASLAPGSWAVINVHYCFTVPQWAPSPLGLTEPDDRLWPLVFR